MSAMTAFTLQIKALRKVYPNLSKKSQESAPNGLTKLHYIGFFFTYLGD